MTMVATTSAMPNVGETANIVKLRAAKPITAPSTR